MNATKLFVFVIAALALLVLPVAFAVDAVKPTVIDGFVFSGSSFSTPPVAGVNVDVTCEDQTLPATTNSNGYFKVDFDAGDCSLGENVTVCAGENCQIEQLLATNARINIKEFKLFNVPEFGTIAASLAVAGAGAGYLALRRRK
ncbi:MAG: hypothetical protein EPN86_05775 [Nanoarchaeota archaeon]|nr:MAG: hypothetical protein EPN86_05775 [Nanoarchaeota archaeon]